MFVSRSNRLCRYVEGAVGSTIGSTFTTFDKLANHLGSLLCQETDTSFNQSHGVDFARFSRDFYMKQYPKEKISALIAFKAIRTLIKGSIEAFQSSGGILSKDCFISGRLGKQRCKILHENRERIYEIFVHYQQWLKEQMLWDECDRTGSLLLRLEEAKKSNSAVYEEKIRKTKIYIDVREEKMIFVNVSMQLFI